MCWKVRRFSEAESELRETLRLDPQFQEAKYYLADTYLMDQKPRAALPLLQALAGARPSSARAQLDLGKALEQLNRDAEAVSAYQACTRADPKRPEPHYQLARAYKRLHRPSDSERELAIAQKLQREKREGLESLLQASGTRRPEPAGRPISRRFAQANEPVTKVAMSFERQPATEPRPSAQ
jgi:tetratricopeptide (TPR) repeat protein